MFDLMTEVVALIVQEATVFKDSKQALGDGVSVSIALGDIDGDIDALIANQGSRSTTPSGRMMATASSQSHPRRSRARRVNRSRSAIRTATATSMP